MEDIAHEAGVGRMTLYGHYRTRAILLTAALEQALVDGEKQLSGIDLGGAPREALTRLLTSSWALVAESASLLTAADGVVPADQLKAMHAEPALRITALLRRGQAEGAFRRDLSDQWLGSAIHFILHGAATEVRNGNLSQDEAARVVVGTIDAMVRPNAPDHPSKTPTQEARTSASLAPRAAPDHPGRAQPHGPPCARRQKPWDQLRQGITRPSQQVRLVDGIPLGGIPLHA